MVYACFRSVKAELTKDDFVVFMRWLQDFDSGPLKESMLEVERDSMSETFEPVEPIHDTGTNDDADPDEREDENTSEGGANGHHNMGNGAVKKSTFGPRVTDRTDVTSQGLPDGDEWLAHVEKEHRTTNQDVPLPRDWGGSWHTAHLPPRITERLDWAATQAAEIRAFD